jgi:hypothetical protein
LNSKNQLAIFGTLNGILLGQFPFSHDDEEMLVLNNAERFKKKLTAQFYCISYWRRYLMFLIWWYICVLEIGIEIA